MGKANGSTRVKLESSRRTARGFAAAQRGPALFRASDAGWVFIKSLLENAAVKRAPNRSILLNRGRTLKPGSPRRGAPVAPELTHNEITQERNQEMPMFAETIIHNANVETNNVPWVVQAIAIVDGRIKLPARMTIS